MGPVYKATCLSLLGITVIVNMMMYKEGDHVSF
jgi:hypothetical protein